MDHTNSQTDFYVDLLVSMIVCDPLKLSSPKHLRKDIESLRARCASEGLSFLTKTLPKLGKALDKGLEDGTFSLPGEFKHSHQSKYKPAFLQVYFNAVFGDDGHLLDIPNAYAVKHLRQVLFAFYKLKLDYSSSEEEAVLASFKATEAELKALTTPVADQIDLATWIVDELFRDFDPLDIVPRHGPGAVATGEKLDGKYAFGRYYNHLHQFYPFSSYMRTNLDHTLDLWDEDSLLPRLDSGVAKVVLVPKDSRGPRLISCEPLEYQWIQQGLGRAIVSLLESHPLTKGRINFSNQEVNRDLAMLSSVTREYATLDLKDASDRNSLDLVRTLFRNNPNTLRALESCRTKATLLPNGEVVPLVKFAPMGSACCFPIEAVCFWALVVAARSIERQLMVSTAAASVYVYGDDIIVPTEDATLSIHALELCHLKVNVTKSCIKGHFRESCGMDAFYGVNVTPVRVKTLWTDNPKDGNAYASYVAYANSFRARGYEGVFALLVKTITRTYGNLPYGTCDSSYPNINVEDAGTAEVLNLCSGFKHRYDAGIQREQFRLKFVSSQKRPTELDSWSRLLRNVTSGEQFDPSTVVLPYSTVLKYGWRCVD